MWPFVPDFGLAPKGACLLWEPSLVGLQLLSDGLNGLASLVVGVLLFVFARSRPASAYGDFFRICGAFAITRALVNVAGMLTMFVPAFLIEGLAKSIASLVAVAAAVLLWPLLSGADRSESRYRLLAENARDLILEFDLAMNLIYVSPASRDLLGRTPKQMMSMIPMGRIHADDLGRLTGMLRAMIAGQDHGQVVYRYQRPDGSWIWLEVLLRLMRGAGSAPTSIMGAARDVSGRVMGEESLKRSEARCRLLADNMADSIACLDEDFQTIYASASFRNLIGFEPEELVGQTLKTQVHPEDWDNFRTMLEALQAGEQPGALQYRLRCKDGSLIWAETQGNLMPDKREVILAIHNVTAKREVEERLRAANARLEEMARSDGLTGLANRRRFDEALDTDFKRCMRNATPLSLILMDVDRFKLYNDRYGHQAGDVCLQKVAGVTRLWARRPGDLAARYGGEEFVILLPDTNAEDAAGVAERIAASTRELGIEHAANASGVVTASFGVATIYPMQKLHKPADLIRRADQLLYTAKERGRDRVMVSDMDQDDAPEPLAAKQPADSVTGLRA